MIVYVTGRQMGKTEAVIRWFLENPMARVIIVVNQHRKMELLSRLKEKLSLDSVEVFQDRIIVPREAGPMPWIGSAQVAIDNAEEVFQRLLGKEIDFITVNGTELDG